MTSEVDALIERLRAKVPSGQYTIGSGVVSSDGKVSHSVPSLPIMKYANPDGPQAADLIAAQREALEAIARGRYDGLEVSHLSAKECRAILAALPQWRPISEAPRDGTDILLFHKTHGPIAGRFSSGEWSEETPLSPREYSGAVWVLGDDIEQVEVEEMPDRYFDGAITHFMPLPAPPETQS